MSHKPVFSGDPSVNQDIVIRKARNTQFVFRFLDVLGEAYAIEDDFAFRVKSTDRKPTTDVLEFLVGTGLTITDNEILVDITDEDSDIDRQVCFYELYNRTTKQTWFTGKFIIITGDRDEDTTQEVTATISTTAQVLECTLTIAGNSGSGSSIRRAVLDVSGASINMDMDGDQSVFFFGNQIIDGIRTWQISDDVDSLWFRCKVQFSGSFMQTLEAAVQMKEYVGDWDSAANQWTPPKAGVYEIEGFFDGTQWDVEIAGPFV